MKVIAHLLWGLPHKSDCLPEPSLYLGSRLRMGITNEIDEVPDLSRGIVVSCCFRSDSCECRTLCSCPTRDDHVDECRSSGDGQDVGAD